MENKTSRYDEFGKPKFIPCEVINAGDKVCYFDVERIKGKLIRTPIYGIWDGEKAEFEEKKIVVRTTKWLIKVKNNVISL